MRLQAGDVEDASEYIVRATRGFLQNPRADEQIADDLTLLLKGDIPPHWEPSPTIGLRLAVPPFFELPAPLRRQAMETFPSQKLFREPQVEVLAWLSLGERERAAQRLEELVLTGSVYAREDLRDALPAWRELLQTLLDRLGSSPEDLQALATELLRSVAPAGTAPSDFAEEVRRAFQQRERR